MRSGDEPSAVLYTASLGLRLCTLPQHRVCSVGRGGVVLACLQVHTEGVLIQNKQTTEKQGQQHAPL